MNPLAPLFAAVWGAFIDGMGIGEFDTEKLVEATGLAEWRPATEADVAASDLDIEVGDPILCLTEAGRQIIREAKEAEAP